MIPRSQIRLNVHPLPTLGRFTWSVSAIDYDGRGVPSIRLLEHGSGDIGSLDLAGVAAVSSLLIRAVDHTA